VGYLARQDLVSIDEQWLVDCLTNLAGRFDQEAESLGHLGETTSFLFGELPVLLQLLSLTGEPLWRARALTRIASSEDDEVREMMWGTPGVLILTRLISDAKLAEDVVTHDAVNIAKLFDRWNHEHEGLYLWKEELYGSHPLIVGAVHGFFGQVLPLLQRIDSLSDTLSSTVLQRTRDVLCQTAIRAPGLANWPVLAEDDGKDRDHLLHYCHGAPGVIISACDFPNGVDAEVDQLLVEGGELVWKAGPLVKGSNLCHGTTGNGYAFLKLFERTGDQLWLDRARGFAMHAIGQYENVHRETGHGRFSLWTGDPGLAVFLNACLDADARFPTIDVF